MNIYVLIKRVVSSGAYEKDDMLNKLDLYLLMDRITEDQYREIVDLIK